MKKHEKIKYPEIGSEEWKEAMRKDIALQREGFRKIEEKWKKTVDEIKAMVEKEIAECEEQEMPTNYTFNVYIDDKLIEDLQELENNMIKSIENLQVNDIVTFRDGDMLMIHEINNELFAISDNRDINLKFYNDNLKEIDGCQYIDIMCVRRPEKPYQLKRENWENAPVIWERVEPTFECDELVEVSADGYDWEKRYYAFYENGVHYCWANGTTSNTVEDIFEGRQEVTDWPLVRKCEQEEK